MNRILTLGTVATLLAAIASPALASDARSIALGGAVVANGKGVHGALSNPASLMSMNRRGESIHVRFGFSAEVRDTGEMIETFSEEDNRTLIEDIEGEIDTLSATNVECNPFLDDDDTVCISGTQGLSDYAGDLLDIIDVIDDETIEGMGAADFGMAKTNLSIPFAINLRASVTAFGAPDIAEGDRSYIADFNTILDNDSITLGEFDESDNFTVDAFGIPAEVVQPEDVLTSNVSGAALLRTQFSVSLAKTFAVAGHNVDFGITPKISALTARSIDANARDEFLDDVVSAGDRFEDSEVTENSFTADLGASMALPTLPVQVAAVIRNLIPESIKTNDDFEFETTPQLIIGAAFAKEMLSITGDIALNSAKQDNFETQKIGVGVEFGTRIYSIRGGIAHDAAREEDSTALTLGFGLGPLEIGGRVADVESIELGAQLAFSFK